MKLIGCALGLAMALSLTNLIAGTDMAPATDGKDMKAISPQHCYTEKDWTLELGSGVAFSNVRSGQPNQAYTIIPVTLTASLKLDDVSLDNFLGGFLRGYSEFFFRGDYGQIVRGPETHYEGMMAGPRYNFVQPGWKIIPYVEGGVGIDFADSKPQMGRPGTGFQFHLRWPGRARSTTSTTTSLCGWRRIPALSNAGLSEPQHPNHPIDELGPKLSFGYSF
jgi:hypothetical protein